MGRVIPPPEKREDWYMFYITPDNEKFGEKIEWTTHSEIEKFRQSLQMFEERTESGIIWSYKKL